MDIEEMKSFKFSLAPPPPLSPLSVCDMGHPHALEWNEHAIRSITAATITTTTTAAKTVLHEQERMKRPQQE